MGSRHAVLSVVCGIPPCCPLCSADSLLQHLPSLTYVQTTRSGGCGRKRRRCASSGRQPAAARQRTKPGRGRWGRRAPTPTPTPTPQTWTAARTPSAPTRAPRRRGAALSPRRPLSGLRAAYRPSSPPPTPPSSPRPSPPSTH